MTEKMYNEIKRIRERQNEQWKDKPMKPFEFYRFIYSILARFKHDCLKDEIPSARDRLIKIAACAIAGIELIDKDSK